MFPDREIGQQREGEEHEEMDELVLFQTEELAVDMRQAPEVTETQDGDGHDV